jgi:hypothetical protein
MFAAKPRGPEQWTLHLKSEPTGAEVKAPQGQSCRTPCELVLPMADTTVTFSLNGYYSQSVPVKWLPATFHYELYEHTEELAPVSYPTDFSPNPVIAQLEPAPAGSPTTAPTARRKPPPKQKTAARPPIPTQPGQASPFPPPATAR